MMKVVRQFALHEPVLLPQDTVIRFPKEPVQGAPIESGCSGCSVSQCNSALARSRLNEKVLGKFLAISVEKATYVALDKDVLDAFNVLLAGEQIGRARDILHAKFGSENGDKRLTSLLAHLSLRNFFSDAVTDEYTPARPNLQLYTTNRCNLRCTHCYMNSGEPLADGETTIQDRNRAIDLFAKIVPGGKVTFTGGEALLSAGIHGLLKRAYDHGLYVELYSNGLTIKNEDQARKILAHVHELQISLDGATRETNDPIRGKGTFEPILRAIKIVDKVIATSLPNHKFRIAMTLTASNAEDIRENLGPLIQSLNLKTKPQIRLGTTSALGRAAGNTDVFSSVEELRMAQATLTHELAMKGVYRLPVFKQNRFSKTCGMGATITLGADGSIYPCSITDQDPIANIADADAEAAMSSVLAYVKDTDVDHVEGCRSCSMRYFCGGMCRITNLHKKGTMTRSACTPEYKEVMTRTLISRYESFALSAGVTDLKH